MLIRVLNGEHRLLCGQCRDAGNSYFIDNEALCDHCYEEVMNAHGRALRDEMLQEHYIEAFIK